MSKRKYSIFADSYKLKTVSQIMKHQEPELVALGERYDLLMVGDGNQIYINDIHGWGIHLIGWVAGPRQQRILGFEFLKWLCKCDFLKRHDLALNQSLLKVFHEMG